MDVVIKVASPSPGYEFTETQNKTMGHLAMLMKYFAYSLFMGGALQALLVLGLLSTCIRAGEQNFPILPLGVISTAGILGMFLALRLLTASKHFRLIVKTQGSDIDHLMVALERLRGFFLLSGGLLWLMVLCLLMVLGQGLLPTAMSLKAGLPLAAL